MSNPTEEEVARLRALAEASAKHPVKQRLERGYDHHAAIHARDLLREACTPDLILRLASLFHTGEAGISRDLEAAKGKPEVLLYGRFERDPPKVKRWVIGQWFVCEGWKNHPEGGWWAAYTLPFLPEVWSPLPEMKKGGG